MMIAGAILAIAALILGISWVIVIGIALLLAGAPLIFVRTWLLRHPAAEVRARMTRSVTLLGLQCEEKQKGTLSMQVPQMQIGFRPFGRNNTLVRFSCADPRSRRERVIIDAMIKCHKTIRLII